ncbi:MAG: FolB domain-containing protein, partial [Prevotella sp.]|nr:FolB domain-containing protein [Prevotella sp.]
MILDKIIIRDLLTRGPIGISDGERSQPQDILINVILYTETNKAAETDSIEDCVNYSTIVKK